MTKAELVSAMAERSGLSKTQAREALEAFTTSVTETLRSGEEVRLVGFGSFKPIKRPAGRARNPKTGAAVNRPATNTCRFRVGDALKGHLN